MATAKFLACFGCLTGDPIDIVATVKESNPTLFRYLESLVISRFQGETSNIFDDSSDHKQKYGKRNLSVVLLTMDQFIRSQGESFTGNEYGFTALVEEVARIRCPPKQSFSKFKKKLLLDRTRFVEFYFRRGTGLSHPLYHSDYWGTRQQLRAGKVIGDWIDTRYGSMDPIFGTLLSPTAGRTGPGDSDVTHNLLFDNNGPMAFHSAVHDAFGYLLNFHQTGPGYNYLGSNSIFSTRDALSGQISGVEFWSEFLHQLKMQKSSLKVY